MGFKSDRQRKAFFANLDKKFDRLDKRADNLKKGYDEIKLKAQRVKDRNTTVKEIKFKKGIIDPKWIPKGSKYMVTHTKGFKAYSDTADFFKDRTKATNNARSTGRSLVRLPRTVVIPSSKILTHPNQKTETVKIHN